MSINAQIAVPEAKWGNVLDGSTSAGDNCSGVAVGPDGTSYFLANMGSTESAPAITLNGETLFDGAPYNAGNSYNGNLCLIAFNPDGSKKWTVYSTSGDYASNQGAITIDGNGDIVFTAKVRHTDGMTGQQLNIIDASGDMTEFGGTPDKRSYNLMLAKVSAEGNLEWLDYITADTKPVPNAAGSYADFTSDAVLSTALAVDSDNNIYVGGNYRTDLTVAENVVLPQRNVASYTGDSQKKAGNMFIVKYDAEGKYIADVIGSEGAESSAITSLTWAENSLYFIGSATGADSFSFAGKEMEPSATVSLIIGRLDSELNARWANCYKSEAANAAPVIQNASLTVCGNTLWMAAQFNGRFTDPASGKYLEDMAKLREGCILKLDAATGQWIDAAVSYASEFTPALAKTGLTAYFKVLQNPEKPEKIYVLGYVMNAAVGVVLREYDATTLEANLENCWSLVTQGGVPTLLAVATDADCSNAFIATRGNKAFSLLASSEIATYVPTTWSVLAAKFALPSDLQSGIEAAVADDSADSTVRYFDLQGRFIGNDPANLKGLVIKVSATGSEKVILK